MRLYWKKYLFNGEMKIMKKMMKKVALVSVFLVLALNLMACAKETDCSYCGEVKKCELYESTRTGGESYICDDCIELMEDLDMDDLYEKK